MGRVVGLYVLLGAIAGLIIGAVFAAEYVLAYLAIATVPSPISLIKAYWLGAAIAYFAIFTTLVLIIHLIEAR
mgnify:CR=1 FL=1